MKMTACRDYNPDDYINPKPRGFFASLFGKAVENPTRVESKLYRDYSGDTQKKLVALKRHEGKWDIFEIVKRTEMIDGGFKSDPDYSISRTHRNLSWEHVQAQIVLFNNNRPEEIVAREIAAKREQDRQEKARARDTAQTFEF